MNNFKKSCHLVDLADPVNHRAKIKDCKKICKYVNLVKVLKKVKMPVMPIIIGALGTITKNIENGLVELEIRKLNHPNYNAVIIV